MGTAIKAAFVTAFALGVMSTTVEAVVITDCCDWASGWSFSSYGAAAGTASATVEGSGGNPGARLNITTVTPTVADIAYGTAVLTTSTQPAPVSGTPFTLSLDVLSGPGAFGQGQGIVLLVQQGTTVYAQLAVGATGFPVSPFTTQTFTGTFTPGAFARVIGSGPTLPVFDGSTPTQFGFAAGNSNSGTLTQYYDNFTLSIGGGGVALVATPVPTLSQWALILLALGLGVLGTATAVRRHR